LRGTLKVGDEVKATVDVVRRAAISRNHSATHLLHWALREVLGTHAKQSGSLVTPQRLRFDFTHFQAVTPEELERIEALANARVLDDVPVATSVSSKEEATSEGAIALFGEKYGETVRVVRMGDFSMELCGGIHVERSGAIGPIRIISESGIGAGLRRIEATSGFETLRHFKGVQGLVQRTSRALKVPEDQVPERVEELLARLKEYERTSARESAQSVEAVAAELSQKGKPVEIEGVSVLTARVPGQGQKTLRDLADVIINKGKTAVVALAGDEGGKAQLVVKVAPEASARGLDAREIARAGGEILGGGGGGRADMAVAGGSNVEGLNEALAASESAVRKTLEGSI
jgi:alanyl-tRNA synthetase